MTYDILMNIEFIKTALERLLIIDTRFSISQILILNQLNFIIMKNATLIGLKETDCKNISEKLNILLANYSVFYQNTRGSHWNIKGEQFFTLHPKFEELYNSLVLKIDEIAERILTLGATPAHNYSDYLQVSTIKESKEVSDGNKSVEIILESFKVVIDLQRELLDITDEAGDEGTNSQMSDYITEQEKEVWMYNSYLGK